MLPRVRGPRQPACDKSFGSADGASGFADEKGRERGPAVLSATGQKRASLVWAYSSTDARRLCPMCAPGQCLDRLTSVQRPWNLHWLVFDGVSARVGKVAIVIDIALQDRIRSADLLLEFLLHSRAPRL